MDTWIDFLLKLVGVLGMPAILWLGKMAIDAWQAHTSIKLSDQQQATLLSSLQTAANTALLEVSKGRIRLDQIDPNNRLIAGLAQDAVMAVPTAATAMGITTTQDAARIVVGKIADKLVNDPTIPTVPPVPAFAPPPTPEPVPLPARAQQ